MKVIAVILSILLAFPSLGHSLSSDCCSDDKTEIMECHADMEDAPSDCCGGDQESSPCGDQCDCSCCHGTIMASETTKDIATIYVDFVKTEPLNPGTSFASGISNLIWQPPKLGC